MAYYFKPLEYNPYQYEQEGGERPTYRPEEGNWGGGQTGPQWDESQQNLRQGQFQDYSGQQFQSLFDAVNNFGINPMVTGEKFQGTPQYSPYEGTRASFTTAGPQQQVRVSPQSNATKWVPGPSIFNEQGYYDARLGSIDDYLSRIGSFFGHLGPQQSQSSQQILANAPAQGPRPIMPSVGSNVNIAGGGGITQTNPFPSYGVKSGGWGTAPTSLFGAGAGNANNP